jgi:hypothetical protein
MKNEKFSFVIDHLLFVIFHFSFGSHFPLFTMKIQIAVLIDFEDENEPETDTVLKPSSPPFPFSPGKLFQRFLREVREGRNPDLWEDQPHGAFFKG